MRAQGPYTPPAKVTRDTRAATGLLGAGTPPTSASAAAAAADDISLHECPGFKVSAGVGEGEEGVGEARVVGAGARAGLQEED